MATSKTTPRAAAQRLWQLGANITAIPEGGKGPAHNWNSRGAQWTSERQPDEFIPSLKWNSERRMFNGTWYDPIATVGVICGINGWRWFDVDAVVLPDGTKVTVPDAVRLALLEALGLPADYPWCGRSKSGKGLHIAFRCAGELPEDIAAAVSERGANDGGGPGVKVGVPTAAYAGAFDHIELRWERCQTVLPGPTGYNGHIPDEPPAEVSVDQVVAAFRAVAAPKQRKAAQVVTPPAPKVRTAREPFIWNDTVRAGIRDSFDLVAWFQRELGGDTRDEPGGEVRILGHMGLLVNPDKGVWRIHGEDTGGEWVEAVEHTRFNGRHQAGADFFEVVRIAADFAGVALEPERVDARASRRPQQGPAEPPTQAPAQGQPSPPAPPPAPPRETAGWRFSGPVIDITDENLGRVTGEIWAAMLASNYGASLYRYGSEIALLTDGALTTVDEPRWRGMVNRVASFIVTKKSKTGLVFTELIPPLAMIRDSLLFTPAELPAIERLSPLPIFDAQGRLLTNGYHPESKTLVLSDIEPQRLSREEALSLLLDDLFVDFPFATQADRANTIVYLLLPFIRELCGALPLFLIDAAQRGTGKTLLNDLVHIIWTGEPAPLSDLPLNAEEQRKAITTHLMSAPVSVVFDDIPMLAGHAIQRAVTGQVWTDRLLGGNKEVKVPIRTVWVATGNNVTLGGDMVRRTVLVRLESAEEHPSQRTGFKREEAEQRAWTHENRARLVSACTSLVAYGLAHGKPGTVVLGGFDQFARVVTRILDGIGVHGFCENLTAVFAREDGRQSGWKSLVRNWWDAYGTRAIRAGDVAQLIEDDEDCEIVLDGDTPRARATATGKYLKAKLGAVFAYPDVRLRIEFAKTPKGDPAYRLNEVTTRQSRGIPHQEGLAEPAEPAEHSSSPYASGAHARTGDETELPTFRRSGRFREGIGTPQTPPAALPGVGELVDEETLRLYAELEAEAARDPFGGSQ